MNMHKPPKTKLITMSTYQEHMLSKHSLPMTSSSTTKTATSSQNQQLITQLSLIRTDHLAHPEEPSNGQKIKLSADTKNPLICPVQGALQMVMRARCLAKPDDMPVACYRTKKAPLLFITGSRIATLLQEAVMKVRPSTSADDLKKCSAHSLHVWACVLLDEAGMSPSFIQKPLRLL